MEDDVGVEGYVLVEGPLLHLSDEVPGDGEQQQAVAEGEGGGRAPGHRDPDTHHVPQVPGIEFTFNFLSSLFNHSPAKKHCIAIYPQRYTSICTCRQHVQIL